MIAKPDLCEICNKEKLLQMHIEKYKSVWVCTKCHNSIHRIKRIKKYIIKEGETK
jgi:ribosomal protein L37AE/L43A